MAFHSLACKFGIIDEDDVAIVCPQRRQKAESVAQLSRSMRRREVLPAVCKGYVVFWVEYVYCHFPNFNFSGNDNFNFNGNGNFNFNFNVNGNDNDNFNFN